MTAPRPADSQLVSQEVLSRLSHELRTPLNSVIGFSQVLKNNRAGNQRAQDIAMLESIRTSGEHLLGIVEDLFDMSSGALDDSTVLLPVDVAAATSIAVEKERHKATAKGLTLDLVVEVEGMVELDTARLVRVVRKLICNALKFTPRGTVLVTVEARPGRVGPCAIVVQDAGIGIAPDLQAGIFEPFTQCESGPARRYEGVGLGLPIARSLAESMGCTLEMESQLGIGSRFTLSLPAAAKSSRGLPMP